MLLFLIGSGLIIREATDSTPDPLIVGAALLMMGFSQSNIAANLLDSDRKNDTDA